jgi:hypothetical protein
VLDGILQAVGASEGLLRQRVRSRFWAAQSGKLIAKLRTAFATRPRESANDHHLAIERVVEVSGDSPEDTISYDQHDQLMKARLDL